LLFALGIGCAQLFGQQNEPINYSPNGLFDNVYDKVGNQYRLEDILIDKSLPTSMGVGGCPNTGYFVLHYDNGSGMEDPNDTQHQARRDVFCQLFSDLSEFIVPANASNEVHIWVRDIDELNPPNGVLGMATSFYVTPQMVNPVGGIVDGMLWQTINSGLDSYSNVVSPLTVSADPNSEDGIFYHGMMAFNFAQLWHTDLSTVAAANTFDLYTVGLHEIIHALGFASLIDDNGQSKLGPASPYFSRYDLFLQSTSNVPLLTNNVGCEMYGYTWNSALDAPSTVSPNPNNLACLNDNTICANAVKFAGTVNQPVYTPNCYDSGSSLSHLEDQCHLPNNLTNNTYYVMSNAVGTGSAFTKRFLKTEERQVLCDIGYMVRTTFGVVGNIHHTYNDYGGTICNNNEQIAGINDGIDDGGGYVWDTAPLVGVSISGSVILSNDFGESSVSGFSCLEVIIGGGTVSATQGNDATNITYTPPANSFGVHLLRYIPTDGTRLGNITYIFVFVGQANCEPSACDLINNGSFEMTNWECTSIAFSNNHVSCWSRYRSSPDLYGRNCAFSSQDIPIPNSYTGVSMDTWNNGADNNNHFVGLWGHAFGTAIDEEAIQSLLTSPLVSGSSYTLRFWAMVADSWNSSDAPIAICSSEQPLVASGQNYNVDLLNQLGNHIIVPGDGQWHYLEMTFQYDLPQSANNIIIGYDASFVPIDDNRFVFLDDISLIPNEVGNLNIQPNTLCTAQIIEDLSGFAVPPGGTFSGPGVTEIAGIFSFDASVVGVGTHTIIYEHTNNLGCEIYLTDEITVLNSTTFQVAAAPDAVFCAGQSYTLSVLDPIAGATYTWSPSTGLSSDTGISVTANPTTTTTYNVTTTNGGCSSMGSIEVVVAPAITATITIVNTISGQCIGTVTANVAYSGPLTDLTFAWWYNGTLQTNTTNTITNACVGSYSCVITSIYGCTATIFGNVVGMEPPLIVPVLVNDGCIGNNCGGSISITANIPFTLTWAGPGVNGVTTPTINNLCAGSYIATFVFTGYPVFTQTYVITSLAGTVVPTVLNNATTLLNQPVLVVSGNITVEAGGTLNVSNAVLYFQPNAKLIVKAGGKLEASNATFTAGCPSYWSGIEVQGVQDFSQNALVPDPLNLDPVDNYYQGRANFNGKSVISKALIGIRAGTSNSISPISTDGTTGGGKITAAGTEFINNRRDVYFSEYWSFNNSSKFTNCLFLTDANYMTSGSMLDRVTIWLNRFEKFAGCTWRNTHAQWIVNYPTVNCIFANSGPFSLAGPSLMEGFHRGIKTNGIFTGNYSYSIKGTTFKCYRGILMENPLLANITGNTFNSLHTATYIGTPFPQVPAPFVDNMTDTPIDYINNINTNQYLYTQWKSAYGLYLQSPIAYTVKDNLFQMSANSDVMRVGLYVNGNDANANDIYRNKFYDMIGGCRFYNDNRGENPNLEGLRYSCNDFRGNVRDVEINNAPAASFLYNASYGIRQIIGSSTASRNNTFQQLTTNPGDDDDIRNFTENQHIYYWNLQAMELTPSEVAAVNIPLAQSSVSCTASNPPILNVGGLTDAMAAYATAKALYQALVDGGDTEQMLTEVELAEYAEAIELYQSLMAKSPALSQDVMLEAIAKEYDLPAVLLTAILASNPSAAKNSVIQKELDQRQYPLTSYQRQLIDLGINVISTKESMEVSMGDLASAAQFYMIEEYERIAEEVAEEEQTATFEALLNVRTDEAAQFFKVHALLAQGKYTEAEVLCNSLLAVMNIKSPEYTDYNEFLSLLPLHQQLSSTPEAVLTEQQKADMIELLQEWKPKTYALAMDILTQWSDYQHEEPLDYPEYAPQPRSMNVASEGTNDAPAWLTIYPNPASDYVSIRLDNAPLTTNAVYHITDVQGKLVAQGKLGNPTNEYIVNLSKLAKGFYSLTISDMGQKMHTQKVIVE
jgi:Secretion system C-terminal sorting domain